MSTSSSEEPENVVADERQNPRFRRLVKIQYGLAEESIEATSGWVSDCSLGGLCLLVHKEYVPGTVLVVRPTLVPANTPWIQVEVKNCRPGEGDSVWELGCQFTRTPAYSTLLLFR